MKRLGIFCLSILWLLTATIFQVTSVEAQGGERIRVAEGNICADVVDRVCINANTSFSSQMGRLFCYTRLTGAQEPSQVTHIWYHGDTERARIRLAVKSANWRTFSSKIILPHEVGNWRVDVLGPDDQLLVAVPFELY